VLFLKKIATFLHITVAKRRGLETLDHYLDDFFFAGQDSTNGCLTLTFDNRLSSLDPRRKNHPNNGPVFLNLSFLQRLYVKMLQFFSKIAQDREHPIGMWTWFQVLVNQHFVGKWILVSLLYTLAIFIH
jgi:hypothetical protein